MNNQQNKIKCQHTFATLGFSVYNVTNTRVKTVGAIFCTRCGLFRTKILIFRRELEENDGDNSSQ